MYNGTGSKGVGDKLPMIEIYETKKLIFKDGGWECNSNCQKMVVVAVVMVE
jgi:hypothetical protein